MFALKCVVLLSLREHRRDFQFMSCKLDRMVTAYEEMLECLRIHVDGVALASGLLALA